MATWSPASVRRSGCCWAASVTGNSNSAAIRSARMGPPPRGSVDGATGAGRGVFHDRAGVWLLPVTVACLPAGVVSLVVPGAIVPALRFAAGTLLSLVGIRPFLLRRLHPRGTEIRTNVDALAGRVGIVC